MFSPKKFSAAAIASIGGDLWGYLQGGQAHADYYLDPNGTPTNGRVELHGALFERLGVTSLDRDVFERLAAGCHPVSGQRLVQTSHVPTSLTDPASGRAIVKGGFHVPGIDCNLSPPKSVSALLPFLSAEGRAELEAAHLAAVRATLAELEVQVPLCRPTLNGQQVHAPGELGIAVFTHHTSRPSPEVAAQPGRPPDPQLHSHAFLFNLAWCQGRYLAIDSKPLLRFASTAEAIYTCELAAQLQQLGYRLRWQQTRRGSTFELDGVDPRLIELFSSRHRHIQQLADQFQAARGRPPPRSSGATWPPATAPPRPPPATRRTGPPTTRSSTSTASPSQLPTATGTRLRQCPWLSGKPPSAPGSSPPMGSLVATPPSTSPA